MVASGAEKKTEREHRPEDHLGLARRCESRDEFGTPCSASHDAHGRHGRGEAE